MQRFVGLVLFSLIILSVGCGDQKEKGFKGRARENPIKHYYCPFCDVFQGTWLDFGGRSGSGLYGVEDKGPNKLPTFPSGCSDCGREFGTDEMYWEFK